MMERLVAEAQAYPGLTNIDTDLRLNSPQLKVDVNRRKAAALGVDVETRRPVTIPATSVRSTYAARTAR
jgi:multidrug efflux pump subunit AcrB